MTPVSPSRLGGSRSRRRLRRDHQPVHEDALAPATNAVSSAECCFSFERGGEVVDDRRQCGELGEHQHVSGIDAGGGGCAKVGRHGVEKRRGELLVVIWS
jgi:hypothetical protein